jgi:hypothetical protein
MAATHLRSAVLGGYRRLMRLRLQVFAGDDFAISEARKTLRVEFSKNKSESDPEKIGEPLGVLLEVAE